MGTPSGLTPGQVCQEGVRTAAPFVGRHRCLTWFARRLAESCQGYPQVVLLEGDTGVGKSRLLEQICTLAHNQNMQVYHGRCDEDNAVAYLPWIGHLLAEMLPPLERQGRFPAEVETIRGFLHLQGEGSSTPHLAAEHHKLRLFLAVSRAVIALATQTPTLLIMDDLHWADGPSLELFSNVVFSMAEAGANVPLLLVGTYVPLLAREPLKRALASYQRERIAHARALSSLDELELYRFLQALGVTHPAPQLVAALRTTTQGNPLFLQEVVRALQQRQALQEHGGVCITTIAPDEVGLPTQVTSSITTQLQRLSKGTTALLTLAACLRTPFSAELLSQASTSSEEEVLDALDEGLQQQLLQEHGRSVQFAHPLIKHVLYTTLTVPRRQRLHHQLAQALAYGPVANREASLRALAPHLIRAGLHGNAAQAVWYAQQAGDLALRSCRWEEAAGHYEAALQVAVSTDIATAPQCAALHAQAGLAHGRARDLETCLEHYRQAESLYRALRDTPCLARLLVAQARAYLTFAPTPSQVLAEIQQVGSLMAELAEHHLGLRGHLAVVMAELYGAVSQREQAQAMLAQALSIARQTEDAALYAYAYVALGVMQGQSGDHQGALESWQRSGHYAQQAMDPWLQGPPLWHRFQVCLAMGQLEEARLTAATACTLARQIQDGKTHTGALATLAFVALAQGDFTAVAPLTDEALPMACRYAAPWSGVQAVSALACAYALRGEWTDATETLALLTELQSVFPDDSMAVQRCADMFRQWVHTYANLPLPDLAEPFTVAVLQAPPAYDTQALGLLCALVECAQRQGTPQVAAQAYDTLTLAVHRGIMFSSASGWLFLLPRVLGVAALLCGQQATAATHLHTAFEVARQAQAEPELGRTYLDYARLLYAQQTVSGDQQARAAVQEAQRIFSAYGMQPFLQQAAELLDLLQRALPTSQALLHSDVEASHTEAE